MRQKLNENPVYQAAAIGVLALLVGVMLMMRMGGGGAEAPPEAGDTGTLAPGTADPAAAATPVVPPGTDPTAAAPVDPAAGGSTAVATGGAVQFKAGPGLPASVVDAYDSGQAVALLVVNDRGIDDRDLRRSVETIGSRADVAVFVTDVKHVADYSRITEGADVNRTPVLIVIRPKRLAEGSMPTVGVAYGFRGPGSVQQAFEDALYDGPDDLPYYP